MITPAELIEHLRRRGYSVTERQLTDWRAKGLLPNLRQQGRGRGHGAIYVWRESNIIDHAATVCELLNRHARTETALLGTWFAGYRIETPRVRNAWLGRLARADASIRREASRYWEIEDLLGRWSSSLAKKQARPELPYHDLDPLFLEVLKAIFDPDYSFAVEESTGLVEIAQCFFSPKFSVSPTTATFSEASFRRVFAFIRENLSLTSIQRLLSLASDDELADAHRRWLACMKAVAWVAKANTFRTEADDFASLGRQFAVVFGPCCILVLSYLARCGAGPMMDATVETLDEFYDRVSDPGSWFQDKMSGSGELADADDFLGGRLAEIWRSFDYSCLLKLSAPPTS